MHLHNYLAEIYLNTQEAGTKYRKFEPTDLKNYAGITDSSLVRVQSLALYVTLLVAGMYTRNMHSTENDFNHRK